MELKLSTVICIIVIIIVIIMIIKFLVQNQAEVAVRDMLVDISLQHQLKEIDSIYAEDFMDEGSKICLTLTIDR